MKKLVTLFLLVMSLITFPVFAAAETFVVKKIDIEGLQRISSDTVYSYLPIKTGDTFSTNDTAEIIKSLYNTGFFEKITLSRKGNVLLITVQERPTIGQLKISGNSFIPKDKLNEVMKSVNVVEGRSYDRAILDKIKLSLLNQYYQLGRYNARVDVTVTPMDRNRVLVKIDISEGLVAKVRRINIIGNETYPTKELEKQLTLSTLGLFTFFTEEDRYSQEKLETSLDNIRNYYLDRGYVKFTVKSSQVAITPDRKSIYVTIVVEEGACYTVKGFKLTGNLILPEADLQKKIKIKSGETFSRKKIVDSEKAISDALGSKGYVFTVVSLEPIIDEVNKTIFLTFVVKPGKRSYVRHIYFSDNTKTNDVVLRREIQQMESSVINTDKLEQSKHRLSLLPYVKDVQMSVVPVQESADLVDVNYKVKEDSAAQANFSVGYSQIDHVILSAGLNQKNFLGTGETFGLNASHSKSQQYYGMNFTDPYYTPDGISRSFNLSASKFNPKYANISQSYATNQYNASVVYGIPIGQEKDVFNRLQLGYGYENTLIRLLTNGSTVSNQVQDFVNEHGRHFQQLDLIAGFSRDGRDKSIFPTSGMLHSVAINLYLPVTHDSLEYYTLFYNTRWYHPLGDKFIAVAKGNVGYGQSFNGGAKAFPFFKNYYAGGIESIRGYEGNTLGPQDSNQESTGGNFLLDATMGLVFPNFVSDNLRTTLFVDGGNVYETFDNRPLGGTASGMLRYSTGVEGDWLTPLGMISVSLAKPLNAQPHDNEEIFQFSLGANFG